MLGVGHPVGMCTYSVQPLHLLGLAAYFLFLHLVGFFFFLHELLTIPSPVLVISEAPRFCQVLLPLTNTWTALNASHLLTATSIHASAAELGRNQQILPVAFHP